MTGHTSRQSGEALDSADLRVTDNTAEQGPTLAQDLAMVINQHSAENASNTPDFLLARFLCGVLDAFGTVTRARDKWYHDDVQTTETTKEQGPKPRTLCSNVEAITRVLRVADTLERMIVLNDSPSNLVTVIVSRDDVVLRIEEVTVWRLQDQPLSSLFAVSCIARFAEVRAAESRTAVIHNDAKQSLASMFDETETQETARNVL